MDELTRTQARNQLADWAAARDTVEVRRDVVVLQALLSGLEKKEIFQITGIARSTINRIETAACGNGDSDDQPG